MAFIVPRSAATSAVSTSNNAASSADGSLAALTAAVATQGAVLNFPSHTKHKSEQLMSSAEASQLARDQVATLLAQTATVPAPASDVGSDGPPPLKLGRTEDANTMDVCAADTPELIQASQSVPPTQPIGGFPVPDTPPNLTSPGDITAWVTSAMEQAQRVNQEKVDKDNKVLLQTMNDNARRESTLAVTACVKDITARLSTVEVSVANTEKAVGDLATTVGAIQTAQLQMQETLAQLNKSLNTSRSAPSLGSASARHNAAAENPNLGQSNSGVLNINVVPSPFNNGNFNRTPDPTKLFVNTKNKTNVSATKFGEAFAALALEANIQVGSFKIIGDALDSRFEVQFTNDTNTATRECAAFLASLSLGRGKYKPQQVQSNDGSTVQFFCNPDKNRAQVRREILCRNLRQILDGPVSAAGKSCYIVKNSSSICIDRRLLVTVLIVNEHQAKLDWNDPFADSIPGFDKDSIEAAFRIVASGGPSP